MVIAEELVGLFVSRPGIDKDQTAPVFDQQAPRRDIYHVVGVCRIGPGPQGFWDDPEHGPAIQLKVSGFNRVKGHRCWYIPRKYKLC